MYRPISCMTFASFLFVAYGVNSSVAQQSSTAAPAALTVELVKPLVQQWPQTVPASGWLAPWQEAIISSETGGLKIASIAVDIGSKVRRGELLAELASESVLVDLHKQEAAVATAEANLDEANANVDRAHKLSGTGALSDQTTTQYLITQRTAAASVASEKAALEGEKIKLQQTRIIAPDDGIISSRSATLGAVVSSGTEMFRIIRQDRVEWQAEVPAQFLNSVREGQTVHIELANSSRLSGVVRLISPTVAKETGRALVYVSLKDAAAQSGQFATGSFDIAVTKSIALPQTSVIQRDGMSYVFVMTDTTHVERKSVSIGRRQGDLIEIASGIDAEANVVKAGGAFLADGATVKVVTTSEAGE
ncbi:efflux RND transporter periplasmic adaptor subunit [Rhizobium rhizogenes]|uniref:efflux RND transporter periplasmic adaptor subunit n=1 Tax=Rhizobium rhizogenes TaxID=359 RepID=UPI0022710BE0|nr:efflux RND transporter periplasmic adaptor subunit [Rhizobium rhizogenes]